MPDDSESRNAVVGAAPTLTWRALAFGLLGIWIVVAGAVFHENVLLSSNVWMISHHMPSVVFSYLMLLALVWNGWICRRLPGWRLYPGELLVVMAMCMLACFPASAGLARHSLRNLILPWYYLPGQPDWERYGLLEKLIAPGLFPAPAPYRDVNGVLVLDELVYRGFFAGLSHGNEWVGLAAIPWKAWLVPMLYWGPLLAFMGLSIISLAFIVHRQWAHHEQLSYPIAQVARTFWEREDSRPGVPDIFRNRLFWVGFVPLLTLYSLDYISCWFPQAVPGLEEILPNFKKWAFPVYEKFPLLKNCPYSTYLRFQRINFAVVGLMYFTSTEVSLTMGLSQILLALTGLFFLGIAGRPLTANEVVLSSAGGYFGYTLILLYVGRRYYAAVFRQAFRHRCSEGADWSAVMAARMLVLSFAGFVLVLTMMGVDLVMAIAYGLTLMMLFLVLTRIICETGIPLMQTTWTPPNVVISVFGAAATGPKSLTLLSWINTIIAQDARESLMPYLATDIHMADQGRLRLRRLMFLAIGTVALAVVIMFVMGLWLHYNTSPFVEPWSGVQVPKYPFKEAAQWISGLEISGQLPDSLEASALGRLKMTSSQPGAIPSLLTGCLLVLAFSAIRFRFARFPIHPVLFVTWGTYPAGIWWASYLIGWFVKSLVLRLGGGRSYHRLKPVFIGIIAAELIAVSLVVVVDFVFYWITGQPTGVTANINSG